MADIDSKGLSFRALQLANEQRNMYGLRYNDHSRYRKHCANRTHRLRSTLKITHGKGREFKKLPAIAPANIQDGHLQLILYEAERAWSYSQELPALANLPSNESKVSSLRHNATGRFRRSVHWSTQLLSQCQTLHASSRLSASSLLEITIYTLILNGRFLRYRDEFDDALVQLSVAKGLLDELATRADTSRDQALYTYFADEIGPEIRYCAHELGRDKSYDVDGIVADVSGKHRHEIVEGYDALLEKLQSESGAVEQDKAKKKLGALMWEGEPVPVRNPELVDVLLKVQDGEAKLKQENAPQTKKEDGLDQKKGKKSKGGKSKRGVAAYDNILLALSDAEEVARKLMEAQQLSSVSSASTAGARDIQFVHAYIVYQLLSRRIQRDLLLISSLVASSKTPTPRRPADKKVSKGQGPKPSSSKTQKEQVDARLYPALVKLLDTILQSLNQMRALPIVDESPDLATAVDARIAFTNARRCLYLSRSYSPVKKYAEALTLIQHATLHIRETQSILTTLDASSPSASPDFYPLAATQLHDFEEDLNLDSLSLKTSWFAYNGGSLDADPKTYKKPLFFDIAWNNVAPDMDRLMERSGKKPQAQVTPAAPAPVKAQTQTKAKEVKAPQPQPVKGVARTKLEEEKRAATPEPQAAKAPARGGLSSLLGGWW